MLIVDRAARALCDDFAPTKRHPMYLDEDELDKERYRARVRAVLRVALDPNDEEMCCEIGREIAGSSCDEAEAVEWAKITRCVLTALRSYIGHGE